MAILFCALTTWGLARKARKLTKRQFTILVVWLLCAITGMFAYTAFLIDKGWELGIPGADMRFYYEAATGLNRGASWNQLAEVSVLYFSELKLGTITYFVFSQFIACLLWLPLFGEQATLCFIYVSFIMISGISAIDVASFFAAERQSKKIWTSHLVITLTCVALVFASYRLLRDVLVFYLIITTLRRIQRNAPIWLQILLMLMCMILRSYSIVLIVPYFVYKHFGEKTTVIACIALTVGMFFSMNLLIVLKQFVNMSWDFSEADWSEIFQFMLFPNVISQSKIIVDWDSYFGYSSYLGGANLPSMYYLMSVWNLFVLGLSVIGLLFDFKEKKTETIVWTSALFNICIMYSLLYNASTTETRQKTMILIPLCFLAANGFKCLNRYKLSLGIRKIRGGTVYCVAVGVFILLLLLINLL